MSRALQNSRALRSLVGGPLVTPKTFKKALAAYQRGDLAKTEGLCLAALKTDPDYFDALHLLAIVQTRTGRHVAALEIFDKAIKLCPNNTELINNRASALNGLKSVIVRKGPANRRYSPASS